ncbi:hypothetical protein ACLKA7_001744 [Drosophila subpalustris]
MALDDFIAASDRLCHFEAILAGSSQTVPSLSSLRIRRDQVQNIWAIIEQEFGRCSKALREDPSNAKDLTAIQAKYAHCYAVYERCASHLGDQIEDMKTQNRPPTQEAAP